MSLLITENVVSYAKQQFYCYSTRYVIMSDNLLQVHKRIL